MFRLSEKIIFRKRIFPKKQKNTFFGDFSENENNKKRRKRDETAENQRQMHQKEPFEM
ncbi:MAG: hypothetical protein IKQ18_06645 [Clostridia bacterium]|nr:hypothetical protein [Clostridia bacterium]